MTEPFLSNLLPKGCTQHFSVMLDDEHTAPSPIFVTLTFNHLTGQFYILVTNRIALDCHNYDLVPKEDGITVLRCFEHSVYLNTQDNIVTSFFEPIKARQQQIDETFGLTSGLYSNVNKQLATLICALPKMGQDSDNMEIHECLRRTLEALPVLQEPVDWPTDLALHQNIINSQALEHLPSLASLKILLRLHEHYKHPTALSDSQDITRQIERAIIEQNKTFEVNVLKETFLHVPKLMADQFDDPLRALSVLYAHVRDDVLGKVLSTELANVFVDHMGDHNVPLILRASFLKALIEYPDHGFRAIVIEEAQRPKPVTFEAMYRAFLDGCSIYEVEAYFEYVKGSGSPNMIKQTALLIDVASLKIQYGESSKEQTHALQLIAELLEIARASDITITSRWETKAIEVMEFIYQQELIWINDVSMNMISTFTNLLLSLKDHGHIESMLAIRRARTHPKFTGMMASSLDNVLKKMEKKIKAQDSQLIGSITLDTTSAQQGQLTQTTSTEGQLSMHDDRSENGV